MTSAPPRLAPIGLLTGGPKTLAALRISTGLAVLLYVGIVWNFTLPPEDLWFPAPVIQWLSFLPASPELFDGTLLVLAISAVAVLVGWRPNLSASLAAAAFFYVGWMTTLTGKVDHSHHLLWVLVILAVSPSANAWSIRQESRAGSYQLPVTAVMVMLGLIYFGAGLQKLFSAGLAWGWSDNLVNTVLAHSWEKGIPVHSWIVDWPLAGKLLGVGALIFELAFLPCMFFPKVRRWVWPAGLLFHWGTWWVLGIAFLTLQAMYVVFLPWDRGEDETPATGFQQRVIVGLIAVIAVLAVSGEDRAWPIAAYPGFDGITTLEKAVVVSGAEGTPELGRRVGLPAAHTFSVAGRAMIADQCDAALRWLDVTTLELVVFNTVTGEQVEILDSC